MRAASGAVGGAVAGLRLGRVEQPLHPTRSMAVRVTLPRVDARASSRSGASSSRSRAAWSALVLGQHAAAGHAARGHRAAAARRRAPTSPSRRSRRRPRRSRTCAAGRINWRWSRWMAPPSIARRGRRRLPRGRAARTIAAAGAHRRRPARTAGVELLRLDAPRERGRRTASPTGARHCARRSLSGAVIGVLGGLVGLILGSLRMPALLQVGRRRRRTDGGRHERRGRRARRCRAGALGPPAQRGARPRRRSLVGGAASIPGALIGAPPDRAGLLRARSSSARSASSCSSRPRGLHRARP